MKFKEVIGQQGLKEKLLLSVQEGRISHAQLFFGNEGCGNLALALAYAQYICCTQRLPDDSCGRCPACNKIQKLIHPDLHFAVPVNTTKEISSEKKPITDHFLNPWREALIASPYLTEQQWYELLGIENKQGNISVQEASRIIEKLNFKPYESDYKVMIVWLPERMNAAAANRLLKLIEEPPSNTLFLLVSKTPEQIIKTIRSRAMPVRVPPIDERALTEALKERNNLTEAHAGKIARLSNGNYSEALRLIENESEQNDYFDCFCQLMRLAFIADGIALMNWAEETATLGREQQKNFLLYAGRLIRESFMLHCNAKDVVYLLGAEESFAANFSPYVHKKTADEIHRQLNLALAHIGQNGNAKIIFTDLAICMARLIKK